MPWTLLIETMLNIMQNFKFDFLENEFWPGMYVLSFISRFLHGFTTGFFSMYRGILELKNDTSISRKNGGFLNKTCCDLTWQHTKNENLLLSL